MDGRARELYRRPCENCGGPACWVLDDEQIGVRVRCAECGPADEMEIWTGGYCCESCNGSMESFNKAMERVNR